MIYVTGIPGTGVARGLQKFADWRAASGLCEPSKKPVVVKVEDYLLRVAAGDIRTCLDKPYSEAAPDLFHVLLLPKPLLYRRWREAFDAAITEAARVRAADRDALVTFHASWYHLGNREYISAIDFDRLGKPDARADLVITFVDDIYDVRSRLSESGGLFAQPISRHSELFDVLLKLHLVLDWRALETTLSERLAAIAGDPHRHYMVAVKHPVRTFDALIYSDKKRLYLSHHISELRRMLSGAIDRATKAREYIDSIQTTARELRSSVVLFEPTTIDEWRFTERDERGLLLPALGERWPLADRLSDLLYDKPNQEFPEFGREWRDRVAGFRAQPALLSAAATEISSASALVETLAEKISKQINSRDHFLVEQTDGIAVYRPYLFGHKAAGVREELHHYRRLERAGLGAAPAIVLHPPEDEAIRPRRNGQECLDAWKTRGDIYGDPARMTELIQQFPSNELFWAALDTGNPAHAGRQLREHIEGFGLSCRPPAVPKALDPDPVIAHTQMDTKRGQEFVEWLDENYLQEFAALPNTSIIQESLTPQQFAARVSQVLA